MNVIGVCSEASIGKGHNILIKIGMNEFSDPNVKRGRAHIPNQFTGAHFDHIHVTCVCRSMSRIPRAYAL